MKRAILLMILLASTAGCGTANSVAASSTSTGVFTTTDLVLGTGATAATGNTVSVNYAGWLYDTSKVNGKGAQFDPGPGPISFVIGGTGVIQGFSQGVLGMRVGGQRRVIIPPELGYAGNPPSGSIIPANATLVFDITLNSVQ
jgi:FKBP-type peptidyl-prolyl cis-trans isomerase FkpA